MRRQRLLADLSATSGRCLDFAADVRRTLHVFKKLILLGFRVMDVLKAIGLQVESLEEFAKCFHSRINITKSFENVWIAHRNIQKRESVISLDTTCLADWATTDAQLPLCSEQNRKPFNATHILREVANTFKSHAVVSYIFKYCYLFVRFENGSFESVENCDLNDRITQWMRKKSKTCVKRRLISNEGSASKKICLTSSPDLFEQDETTLFQLKKKRTRLPSLKNSKKVELATSFSTSDFAHETILLDPILYDWKQHKEILPLFSPEKLLDHIIKIPLSINVTMLDEWKQASCNWLELNIILEKFINQEKIISKSGGYQRILRSHLKKTGLDTSCELRPLDKKLVVSYICDILRRVCPMELFGNSNRQRKKFFFEVAQLLHAAKEQAVSSQVFLNCFNPFPSWRLQMAPYFQNIMALKLIHFLVIDYMLVIIKKHFYVTECGTSGFELSYYKKSAIESTSAKILNELLKSGKIIECNDDTYCLENKLDNQECIPDLQNNKHQLPTAKVRFLPKSKDSSECRLITILPKIAKSYLGRKIEEKHVIKDHLNIAKKFLDCILSAVGTGIQPLHSNPHLMLAWDRVARLKESNGKLYFIKTDISDAFGSVDHSRLFLMLDRFAPDSSGPWLLLTLREWVFRMGKIQMITRRSFSRKLYQNRLLHSRLLSNQEKLSTSYLKDIVKTVISSQRLRIGHKSYLVTGGLCQGGAGPLSNKLCDLYYSSLDRTYFEPLTRSGDAILLRGTDDYLFVTADKHKAINFHEIVQQGSSRYGVKFSAKKLVTNLFVQCPSFNYLGLNFNIDSLAVMPNYERYKKGNILHFIKHGMASRDPRLKRDIFLTQRALKMNVLKLIPIVFNKCRDFRHARKVVLMACCFQANKTLALALYLKPTTEVLKNVIFKAGRKISRMVKKQTDLITCSEISYLYWQSIYNSFHKQSGSFPLITKLAQWELVRLYNTSKDEPYVFHLIHSEIEEVFVIVGVRWWCPWE